MRRIGWPGSKRSTLSPPEPIPANRLRPVILLLPADLPLDVSELPG